MAKRKRMHGRILAVWEEQLGTELTADAAAGATKLYVDDISPFNDDEDEPGGWLMVGDQVVEYTTVDDDASTIKLATGLTAAVSASGDEPEVWVWNDLYDEVDTVQWAQVMPDGKRDQADAIEAIVSDSIDGLPNGDRGRPRESCLIERDGDEWELIKVKGRPAGSRGVKFADYTHEVPAAGEQTFTLPHKPIPESIHLYWNGDYQRGTEWSIDGATITVPDPGSLLMADDDLTVEYAYYVGVATPDLAPPAVDFGVTWKYVQISTADSTNRSASGFDDSSWATGTAPFGDDVGSPYPYFGWPAPVTAWAENTAIWIRKTANLTAGQQVSMYIRYDNAVDVYWNGNKVASKSDVNQGDFTVTIPGASVLAVNTIALRAVDLGGGSTNRAYLDVSVKG